MTTVRLQHPALLTGTRSASWTPVLAISPLGSHAPFRVEFRWTCRRSSQRQLPLSRYRTHRTLLRRRRHPGSLDIRAPWFVGGPCCSAAGPPPSCPCLLRWDSGRQGRRWPGCVWECDAGGWFCRGGSGRWYPLLQLCSRLDDTQQCSAAAVTEDGRQVTDVNPEVCENNFSK